MDPLKHVDPFNSQEFARAYARLLGTDGKAGQASGGAPRVADERARSRFAPAGGELQALRDLRIRDPEKPRQKDVASKRASGADAPGPSTAVTAAKDIPFDDLVKQDFERWLERDGPDGHRAQAAQRMEYAELERSSKLDLHGLALGRIPAKLRQFNTLRTLHIGGNKLDHLPAAVCRLVNLQTLDARDNQMTELPRDIGRLTSLEHLNVDSNELKSLTSEFYRLTSLKTLSARSNQLKLLPARMGTLENLRKLDLANNQLWDIPGTWQRLFSLLEDVDLSNNKLQQLPANCAEPAGKLKLDVSGNPMETLPVAFGSFRQRKRLFGGRREDRLENEGANVKVTIRDTRILQGLLSEGRLLSRRGVEPEGPRFAARQRPLPRPMLEGDESTVSDASIHSFVRDNAEPGEIEGIERVGQPDDADDAVASDWGARRLDAWVEPLADLYANRHGPAVLPLEPEPVPERDPWEAASANLFSLQRPLGGSIGPLPALAPAAPAPAAAVSRPDVLAALRAELAQLPPLQASALADYLNSLPQPMLASALAQLQNGSGNAAWRGL
jgi:hypothetical protein